MSDVSGKAPATAKRWAARTTTNAAYIVSWVSNGTPEHRDAARGRNAAGVRNESFDPQGPAPSRTRCQNCSGRALAPFPRGSRASVRTITPIALVALAVAALAWAVGSGDLDPPTVLLALVLIVLVIPICHLLVGPHDPWLWWVASSAFLVKLAGSAVRYFVLVDAYEGSGDAGGYHSWGILLAQVWRNGDIPGLDGSMGEGTQVVRWITGLIYTPYTPTILGGFFIFASLAFFGQLLFYCAFRRGVPEARLGIYAFFIFFLPAMVFWPSSIGKESSMILLLGLASYGMARAFATYSPVWLAVSGAGLVGAGMIRPHVAALLAAAFAGAVLVGRGTWWGRAAVRRTIVIAVGVVLTIVAVTTFSERFQLEDTGDVDPFIGELERQTQQGGSSVEGEAVLSPATLPAGVLRVLFRPLPHEAHNTQAMASALENTAVFLLLIWKAPAMFKRIRRLRTPYVMMSVAFTVGFVIAFSTVFNLGILARQRSQVLPYLLAVVVALGWDARQPIRPSEPERVGKHLAATP